MASSSISANKVGKKFSLGHLLILLIITTHQVSCGHQHFKVGGEKGWIKPPANQSDAFNQWANRHHFYVGDTLYFKFHHHNDSVLQVSQEDYKTCNTSNPIKNLKRQGGATTIKLHDYGCMHFISGIPSQCQAGEKMAIFVLLDKAPNYGPCTFGCFPPLDLALNHTSIHEGCSLNHYDYGYINNSAGYWPPWQSYGNRVVITASTSFMAILSSIVTHLTY